MNPRIEVYLSSVMDHKPKEIKKIAEGDHDTQTHLSSIQNSKEYLQEYLGRHKNCKPPLVPICETKEKREKPNLCTIVVVFLSLNLVSKRNTQSGL